MKKYLLFLFLLLIPFSVYAEKTTKVDETKREIVTFENCNDISQIWFNKNDKVIRVGLLAYDAGGSSMDKEIQNTICNKLKEASIIELEYDDNYKVKDDYNREMVWLYIDGKLLQKELIKEGLGMVNYVKDDYSYIDDLCLSEANAIKNKKGIWTLDVEEKYCDSGIILEKQEKEEEKEKISGKKLDKVSIIIIVSTIISMIILITILYVRVRNEKKR